MHVYLYMMYSLKIVLDVLRGHLYFHRVDIL